MRLEKKYVRMAGGVVSTGVLVWAAASSGPVQAGTGDDHESGGVVSHLVDSLGIDLGPEGPGGGGEGDEHDDGGEHGGPDEHGDGGGDEHDDPDEHGDGGGDEHDDPGPDPPEGLPLFLSDTEGAPGSKFTIGGRDCNDPEMGTFTEVTVVHEDGTQIPMPQGVTDDEGNWEMTAVIPEDMAEGTLAIEASCFLAPPENIVGFAALQPQTPVFNYASSSFNVTLPSTTTTSPDGNGGDGNGGDGNGGDGDAGSGGGAGATGTGSTGTSAGAAPGINGEADYTG